MTIDHSGADFSEDRKYRYALWRIWDENKPLVMFIGLNPSTANENNNDQTIKKVKKIATTNGYGGFYMLNCFPYVSTDPKQLFDGISPETQEKNNNQLQQVGAKCKDVVFAWGNFSEVTIDVITFLKYLFPEAKALKINKSGSPKHPLYCKDDSTLIPFQHRR